MTVKKSSRLPRLVTQKQTGQKRLGFLLLLLTTLFLVACGGPPGPPPNAAQQAQQQTESIVLPTAETAADAELPAPVVVQEVITEDGSAATAVTAESDSDSDQHTDDGDANHNDDGHHDDLSEGEQTHDQSLAALGSDYLGSYTISDTGFGTEVTVVVDEAANTRTIESNSLPNHQTGEFPTAGNPNTISTQDSTWTFPAKGVYIGSATNSRTPGVAINGVKFEPGTAERANCDSGEVHPIEAIQDVTSLGLDFNNAHVQPTGEYHYHGFSSLLAEAFNTDQDLVHIGFAADGHLMYYSKSTAYQASYRIGTDARAGTNCTYTPGRNGEPITFGPTKDGALATDWEYNESYGDLDACNGTTVDGQYIYLITNDYPYIPRCLMGEVAGGGGPGGGGQPPAGGQGQGEQGGRGGRGGGPPDFDAAAATLGISADALRDAMGPAPGDVDAASATLGIPAEQIEDALGIAGP